MAETLRRSGRPDAAPAALTEFPCIDGARALAAFAVVAHHAAAFVQHGYGTDVLPAAVWAVTTVLGQVGVAAFFVLSGFLLFRPHAQVARTGGPAPNPWRFWARRSARILPAYWLALTGAIVLGAVGTGRWGVRDHLVAYGLVQNYRSGSVVLFGLGVAWTLVIEFSFYLALPFIAAGLRGLARVTRLAPWRAQVVGLLVMGASGLVLRTYWLISLRDAAPSRTWFPLSQLGYWLPCYLDWFAVGMLLAVASARRDADGGYGRALRALAGRAWIGWGLAAIWIWVITRSGFPTLPWRAFGAWEAWWWNVGALAVGALLVLPALVPGPRPDLGRRLLASRPAVLLGVVSYGIYLWNVTFFVLLEQHRGAWWSPRPGLVYVACAVGGTVAIASLSYVILERPVLAAVHRAVGSTRPETSVRIRPTWRIPLGAERARLPEWSAEPTVIGRIRWVLPTAVAIAALALGLLLPTLRHLA
ncbi:MAG: acyltransferase family protein [Actinomycetes bacterium]